MARISVLGKKMAVKTNVKKMRMGMEVVITQPDKAADISDDEKGEDTTKRYDNDEFPTEDEFDRLVREAEADQPDDAFDKVERYGSSDDEKNKSPKPKPKAVFTDEQKERMERNRKLAEEKRRARQLEAAKKLNPEEPAGHSSDEDEQITFINDKTDETPLSQVYESARKSPAPNQNEVMDAEEMFA